MAPDQAAAVLRDLAARANLVFASDDEAGCSAWPATRPSWPGGWPRWAPATPWSSGAPRAPWPSSTAGRRRAPDRVQAVDPVGAGDEFVAGYFAEAVAGRPDPERLATAAAAGAFAVTVTGDWEGLPTRDELATLGARPGTVRR